MSHRIIDKENKKYYMPFGLNEQTAPALELIVRALSIYKKINHEFIHESRYAYLNPKAKEILQEENALCKDLINFVENEAEVIKKELEK